MIRRLLAAANAATVSVLILSGILALNQPPPPPPAKETSTPVAFDVAPPKKPPPQKKPPPPKRAPPKTPPPPAAMLSASLSGLAFGLAAFDDLGSGASDAMLGDGQAVVMTEATVDELPKPLNRSAPEYPSRARARNVQGHVNLSVLIGEDGTVREVAVLEAEPVGVFEEAAKAAVRSWRFQPAMYEGRAVSVRVQQLLRFTLE